jgi:hypothetical protein
MGSGGGCSIALSVTASPIPRFEAFLAGIVMRTR